MLTCPRSSLSFHSNAHHHGSLPQQLGVVWDLLLKADPEGPSLISHAAVRHRFHFALIRYMCLCSTLWSKDWSKGRILCSRSKIPCTLKIIPSYSFRLRCPAIISSKPARHIKSSSLRSGAVRFSSAIATSTTLALNLTG